MATRPATSEQEMAIWELKMGDTFTFSELGKIVEATFVKEKQVNIVGVINGTQYNIPKCLFIEIKGKASEKETPKMDMESGELFYILKGTEAILFEFVNMNGFTIIGRNVITGGTTRIHQSMFAGTVKQYQKQQKLMEKAE